MIPFPETAWERLLKRRTIDPLTECWIWTGAHSGSGYGEIRYLRRYYDVHRLVGWLRLNLSSNPGLQVLHKCDNKRCFNPDHLFLGTQKDNLQDASQKGRMPNGQSHPGKYRRGATHPRAKVWGKKIGEIAGLWLTGQFRQCDIGRFYGLSQTGISRILRSNGIARLRKIGAGQGMLL